jgi:predicted amidohydrolase
MRGKTVRFATTQRAWHETPEDAHPYSESFALEAARRHSTRQVEAHVALLTKAGERGADIVVTGEDITSTGYALTYMDDPSIFMTLTVELSAYCHQAIAKVAKRYRMYIVACFYEHEQEAIYNSAVLFGRDGVVVGRYHKVNLPLYETWLVQNGDGFPVFDTDIGPVGMLICYDEVWPEATAALAMNGAHLVCHPSAASIPAYKMQTRAMDEQVFYVSSTGQGSRIVAPNAKILADAEEQDEVVVTADAVLDTATLAPEHYWEYVYTGIRDHRERHLKLRQAAAYHVLSNPNPPALKAYPSGGLANTPEAIREVFEKQKADYQRGLRGEKQRYHWKWSEDE